MFYPYVNDQINGISTHTERRTLLQYERRFLSRTSIDLHSSLFSISILVDPSLPPYVTTLVSQTSYNTTDSLCFGLGSISVDSPYSWPKPSSMSLTDKTHFYLEELTVQNPRGGVAGWKLFVQPRFLFNDHVSSVELMTIRNKYIVDLIKITTYKYFISDPPRGLFIVRIEWGTVTDRDGKRVY